MKAQDSFGPSGRALVEQDFRGGCALSDAAPSAQERKLRLMLCSVFAGAHGYYDDGEAQDNRAMPFIDFMRDSADDIQRKIWERNRAAALSVKEPQ